MKHKGTEGESRIEGDIQPFTVNEISRYDDARYFIEEPKHRLKSKITPRVPHLGSDSEGEEGLNEDESEKRCCQTQASLSSTLQILEDENSLLVIATPEGCSKPLHEAEVATISHLDTFYVPPQRPGQKGILFYKSLPNEFIESRLSYYEERGNTSNVYIPPYFSKQLKRLCRKVGCQFEQDYERQRYFLKLWNPRQSRSHNQDTKDNTTGLGYYKYSNKYKFMKKIKLSLLLHHLYAGNTGPRPVGEFVRRYNMLAKNRN
jgi:hypothetical protein